MMLVSQNIEICELSVIKVCDNQNLNIEYNRYQSRF